jgi:hypothetical protein
MPRRGVNGSKIIDPVDEAVDLQQPKISNVTDAIIDTGDGLPLWLQIDGDH